MKLKVGLFNESFPPTIDGVSNAVYNYASEITASHGKCTVVTPKYPMVTDNYPFAVYRFHSFNFGKQLGYRVGNVLSPFTVKDLKDEEFDLIHVHSPFASSVLAAEVRKSRRRMPLVLTYHTKFDIDFEKRLSSKSFRKIATQFMLQNIKAADEVWVVSEGAAESLRNIGYTGKYRVMPNGTDFPKGKASDAEIDRVVRIANIQPDELVFLFVGRMMWYKNIKMILDALNIIGNRIPFKMIFVGEGVDRPAMEQYANKLDVKDRIVFVGAVNDRELVRAYFSRADLFLFPSTYDTAGLVVKEAAACSLPSVLVKGSCAAEGVEDGVSGFLCEENAASLASVILNCADKEKLEQVGERALSDVYLSWEDAVEMAYRRYEEIVKLWPRPLPYMKKGEIYND